jgi:hypothetical protein
MRRGEKVPAPVARSTKRRHDELTGVAAGCGLNRPRPPRMWILTCLPYWTNRTRRFSPDLFPSNGHLLREHVSTSRRGAKKEGCGFGRNPLFSLVAVPAGFPAEAGPRSARPEGRLGFRKRATESSSAIPYPRASPLTTIVGVAPPPASGPAALAGPGRPDARRAPLRNRIARAFPP